MEFIVKNFQINIYKDEWDESTAYEIKGTQKSFSSIFELLKFYQDKPVDHEINDIGDCCESVKIHVSIIKRYMVTTSYHNNY